MDCVRTLGRACTAAVLALVVSGCTTRLPGEDDGGTGTNSDKAFFELGQGETGFRFIEDGDELDMVLGGQGLLMFPMPVRGGGFGLPPDPQDYTHPKIPLLDAYIDIDGFNTGVGGHFMYLANYRIPFTIQDNGDFQFNYVAMIVPDEVSDVTVLDGRPAHIHAELQPYDLNEPLVFDRDVIINSGDVGQPLGGN